MNKKANIIISALVILIFIGGSLLSAEELKPVQLDKPNISAKPVLQILNNRKSSRDFIDKDLSLPVLSELLWAAFGINRADSGKRTAPSAVNWQEIEIYVALKNGLYLYNAEKHMLEPIMAKDLRAETGSQEFVKTAPVNLIYVADLNKISRGTDETKKAYSWADTGFIAQNVYIYCAAEGLGTVVRGMVDREKLEKTMNLPAYKKITLAQTVGYTK